MEFEKFSNKDKFVVAKLLRPNPLDPRTAKLQKYSLVQPESAPEKDSPRQIRYSIYIPPNLVKKYLAWLKPNVLTTIADDKPLPGIKFPVNLTLFFAAPDNDLSIDTLGLRLFLQSIDDTLVIVVPNFETHGGSGAEPKNAGITKKIIEDLLDAAGKENGIRFNFDVRVTCATAYSAGYGGLVQSINNELIAVDFLKKIVFYDCLYRADTPKLPAGEIIPSLLPGENNSGPDEIDGQHRGSAFNTRRAILKAKKKNSDLQVIAYCATSGGSPMYTSGTRTYTVTVDKLIDLRSSKGYPKYLFALSLARVLAMARDEGIITTRDIPAAFIELQNSIIPARGQIASASSQMIKSKTGFIPTTHLQAWGDTHISLIDKAAGSFSKAVEIVGAKNCFYRGYPSVGNQGGMLHIAQIFEFAWEEFV